jgi:CubicO group peptidase (beta-lactamase class C family)
MMSKWLVYARAAAIPFVLLQLTSAASALAAQDAETVEGSSTAMAEAALRVDEADLAELAKTLDGMRESMRVPGMSVVIVDRGEVVMARGFGLANVETGEAATANTVYPIGSSSKAFTATLMAMLADDGELDLDETVQAHVPGFAMRDPDRAAALTIRDLLCHRSGLARMDMSWYGGTATRRDVLAAVARAKPAAGYGEAFHYNNPLYMVAGMVAEATTDSAFNSLIRDRFFRPLGMDSATMSIPRMLKQGNEAVGYRWDEDEETHERRAYRPVDVVAPAGAINASVSDLRGWIEFNLKRGVAPEDVDSPQSGQRLLDARWFDEELWRPHISAAPGVGYGLGWMIREYDGKRLIEHGGNIDGFSAIVALMPDEGLGWAILTNLEHAPITGLAVPEIVRAMRPSGDDSARPRLDPTELEQYLGEYPFEVLGETVTVLTKDGGLAVDVPGQMVFTLNPPNKEGRWTFQGFESQIAVSFNRNEEGDVISMTLHQGGLDMEMFREGHEPDPDVPLEELAPKLGQYRFEPANHNWTVKVHHNRLSVVVPGEMTYMLFPPDEDGWWRFRAREGLRVRFDENDTGEITALTFDAEGQTFELPRLEESGRPIPTVDEVMTWHHAANGADAYGELTPIRMFGRITLEHQGIGGDIVVTMGDFNQGRTETELYAYGRMLQAIDGDRVIVDSSFEPYTELKGERAVLMQRLHPALLLDDWGDWFDERSVIGWEAIGGDDTVADGEAPEANELLAVRLADSESGLAIRIWLDPRTWQITRSEHSLPVPGLGRLPVTTTYGDYRVLGGVTLPYRIETDNPAMGPTVTEFDAALVNVEVPEGFFRPTSRDDD